LLPENVLQLDVYILILKVCKGGLFPVFMWYGENQNSNESLQRLIDKIYKHSTLHGLAGWPPALYFGYKYLLHIIHIFCIFLCLAIAAQANVPSSFLLVGIKYLTGSHAGIPPLPGRSQHSGGCSFKGDGSELYYTLDGY
jgi:hypothetical protein